MIKAVLIDFDDTLCYTNSVFTRVRDEYNDIMRSWDLWDEDLNRVMNDFDVANVNALGHFSTSCFPNAFGQAYEEYCRKYNQSFDKVKFDKVVELGYSVFSKPIELLPGAIELLEGLKPEYKLFLVTHGDIYSQCQRIARSGVKEYFDNIYILEKKTKEEYERIIAENLIDKSLSWMVGNSLRYDVALSMEAGLRAIHLDSDSWDFDHWKIDGEYSTAYSLIEVLQLIKEASK